MKPRGAVMLAGLILIFGFFPPSQAAAAAPGVCVEGFDLVEGTGSVVPSAVLTTSASSALVVGSAKTASGQWSARIARFGSGGWRAPVTRTPMADAGLVAIEGNSGKGRWAVGYKREGAELLPYSLRQTPNGAWRQVWVPRGGSKSAVLTDVAVRRENAVWAVGYRLDSAGSQRPHAVRWDGRRWQKMGPPVAAHERGMLTAVSSTPTGGTWIGGSIRRSGLERPYLARRKDGVWKRLSLPAVGAGSITSIMVQAKKAGWAVGYRISSAELRPLVLRWNGAKWKTVAAPELPRESILLDVGLDDGAVVLTGSTWDTTGDRMRPFVARRRGTGWKVSQLKGFEGDAVAADIDGAAPDRGFLAARAITAGALARTCEGPGVSVATRKSARQERRGELAASHDRVVHPADVEPPPRVGLAAALPIKTSPGSAVSVRIVDRTEAAGLPTSGSTYGAVVHDFDGNGQKDIFLGGHGSAAALYLNKDGAFSRSALEFGIADRHGCTATNADNSGLPDLYCTFGGGRGFGVKANELWLDPGGSDPRLAANAGRVRELLGRGRAATVLDYDDDGHKDLVVGQTPNRVDGLPSSNRIYRWVRPGEYQLVRDSGIAPSVGARAFDTGDFDRDGRTDLLMVSFDAKSKGAQSSLRLYRNTPNGLKGVHIARGIKTIGERDAELVDLNGDAKLDLIQLSSNRIRVSLQRGGKFEKVYERTLSYAKALAVGDADGDGDKDIFILRNKRVTKVNDLVLFNKGNGRGYVAVKAPSRHGGSADEVYPIDHDRDGLTAFLALNGRSGDSRPIQLFTFERR